MAKVTNLVRVDILLYLAGWVINPPTHNQGDVPLCMGVSIIGWRIPVVVVIGADIITNGWTNKLILTC